MTVCLLFCGFVTMVFAWLYGNHYVLNGPFIFSLIYVACKNVPDDTIVLWGFPIQSGNLPWVLLVLGILTGSDVFQDLIGIGAGHAYIFLKITLPATHGYNILNTPKFIENFINQQLYGGAAG